MLVNRLGGFLYLILANYLKTEKGFPEQRVGFLMALYGLGTLMAGPCGGYLADRIGRRKTMILSTFLGAASMIHLGMAGNTVHLFFAAWLMGFLGSMYRPASQAAVADVVRPEDRARAYGWIYWAANLGFAGAAAISGLLRNFHVAYWTLFIIDAVAMASYGWIIVFTVRESKPAAPALISTQTDKKSGTWAPYYNGMFVAFLVSQLLVELLYHQADSALPLDMRKQGYADYMFNQVIMINGILICFIQPMVVRMLPALRRRNVLATGALLIGVGLFLPALQSKKDLLEILWGTSDSGIWYYRLSVAVWTLGEIAIMSVVPLFINEVCPPHLRGTYQGAYQLTWSTSFCLAPLIGTYVLGTHGRTVLWVGCLVMSIVAAAIHFAVATRHEQQKRLHA